MNTGGIPCGGENVPENACDVNKDEGTVSDSEWDQLNSGSLQESSCCSKDTLKGVQSYKIFL